MQKNTNLVRKTQTKSHQLIYQNKGEENRTRNIKIIVTIRLVKKNDTLVSQQSY